jgi:flagellar biogenesis protein FliO
VLTIGLLVMLAAAGPALASGPTDADSRPLRSIAKEPGAKGPSADDATPLRTPGAEQRLSGSVTQTVLALGAVIGVIFGLGMIVKRAARRGGGLMSALGPGGRAPSGLLEVLGRYPISRGTTLVLLKMDRRILLLCQSGGGKIAGGAGMTTLCEVTDPEDVASILLKTRDEEENTLAQKFQAFLKGEEKSAAEALDVPAAPAIRSPQAALTGPDSFELSQARAAKPAAAIRTRLNSLRQTAPAGARTR